MFFPRQDRAVCAYSVRGDARVVSGVESVGGLSAFTPTAVMREWSCWESGRFLGLVGSIVGLVIVTVCLSFRGSSRSWGRRRLRRHWRKDWNQIKNFSVYLEKEIVAGFPRLCID